MVYKFRLTFEDDADVSRTFEIKPNNSFLEFHKAIQAAIGFDGSFGGEFILSDDTWRKKKSVPKLEKTLLKNAVFEPYQKFIYVADEDQDWVLYCEMIGFSEKVASETYPKLIKSKGSAPKQRPSAIVEDEESADMDDLAAMLMKNTLGAMDTKEGENSPDEPEKKSIFDEEYGTNKEDLEGFSEPTDM